MAKRVKDDSPTQEPIPPYQRSALVRATYRATLLWTLVGTAAFVCFGWWMALSFLLGAAVAASSFWLLEQTLGWIYRQRRKRRRWVPVLLIFLKYVLLGVVLYYVVAGGRVGMAPFSVGVCVVFLAVISYIMYREAVALLARGRASRTS